MPNPLSWIEIKLTVSPQLSETCGAIIFEETGQGSSTEEGQEGNQGLSFLKAYLPKDDSFRDSLVKLKNRIARLYAYFPDFPLPVWNLCQIFEENWQERFKQFFKPLRVCSRIIICPTWETYEAKPDEMVLRLDPGQAFGTGGHVSTRLCLKTMESLAEAPGLSDFLFSRVLDVGTGSGILALTAACFRARSVLAIDNDPLAVEVARAHVLLNKMEDRIQVELVTPETVSGPFSLILANLTFNDLIPMTGIFKKLLTPGGILITSGILGSQARSLIRAFGREKIPLQLLILEEEWACVVFRQLDNF
jgi:ribosomal protein L11 methyltransferase